MLQCYICGAGWLGGRRVGMWTPTPCLPVSVGGVGAAEGLDMGRAAATDLPGANPLHLLVSARAGAGGRSGRVPTGVPQWCYRIALENLRKIRKHLVFWIWAREDTSSERLGKYVHSEHVPKSCTGDPSALMEFTGFSFVLITWKTSMCVYPSLS